jgi:hypothetical protein
VARELGLVGVSENSATLTLTKGLKNYKTVFLIIGPVYTSLQMSCQTGLLELLRSIRCSTTLFILPTLRLDMGRLNMIALNNTHMEDNLNFFKNGRLPQFFLNLEYNLNFS